MKISNLPDNTRMELHNHIKKIIRKYFKGLKAGSLKYDLFVETMLSKKPIPNWLKENPGLENDPEFRASLVQYIKNAITRYSQLEQEHAYTKNISNRVLSGKNLKNVQGNTTMTIQERQEFKKILRNNGYNLSIPMEFLTSTESNFLKAYITDGEPIPLGWEKVLNYIKKSSL